MNKFMKHALKPLFKAIAKPYLGNPHTPYEAELMAAGAKPVAIMDKRGVTATMAKAIGDGHVVLIGEKEFTSEYRIYVHPSLINEANQAAQILQRHFQDQTRVTEDFVYQLLPSFPGVINAFAKGVETPEMTRMLSGEKMALGPIRVVCEASNQRFEQAVSQEKILTANFKTTSLLQVYAQTNKIADGKEVFARYYDNDKGYEPMDNDEWTHRIGFLLGYTAKDVRYAPTPWDKVVMKIVPKSARAWARKEVMLMDAPRPSTLE